MASFWYWHGLVLEVVRPGNWWELELVRAWAERWEVRAESWELRGDGYLAVWLVSSASEMERRLGDQSTAAAACHSFKGYTKTYTHTVFVKKKFWRQKTKSLPQLTCLIAVSPYMSELSAGLYSHALARWLAGFVPPDVYSSFFWPARLSFAPILSPMASLDAKAFCWLP